MVSQHIVVIGGSAAGPKTAARAKRLDQDAEVTLIQKEAELSMASCGYPYYVEGMVQERDMLLSTPVGVVRDPAFFQGAKGVTAKVRTEATAINRTEKTVSLRNLETGAEETIPYDKLVLCTGTTPKRPPLSGLDLGNIYGLNSLADADALRACVDSKAHKNVVVLGGGLIGVETAEAMTLAGLNVTIVERLPHILASLDPEIAAVATAHMRTKGVTIITATGLRGFTGTDGKVTTAILENGKELPCDLGIVSTGVTPNVTLALNAGIDIGSTGGILTDRHMRTSDPDIFAAGDCVEVPHRITGTKTLAPYGDAANLEGRIAADNAALDLGTEHPGTIDSGICKLFDIAAGSTGLSEERARALGYDVTVAVNSSPDKPAFMGAMLLVSKMVVENSTRRVLGFQCVGPGSVSRQVSIAATAIAAAMTVDQVSMLDLPYAPPFSLAIDHVVAGAHLVQNKMQGLMQGITTLDLKRKLDTGEKPYILDVRAPFEFEEMRLGVGENLIPLGMLRKRLEELPEDKSSEIIVYCKVSLRAYEAQQVLRHHGYSNVLVMEGGIMAWPFPREK